MPRCYIALGGNLGDVRQSFDLAAQSLGQAPQMSVVAVSAYSDTAAVGESVGRFLNAAIAIETHLLPLALLDRLQAVENELGRVRTVRWGPRTIDLDLLFYGSEIIDSPRLIVPHPAAWYRRFVLDPLAEIAPTFVHPTKHVEIGELRARLLTRPLTVALVGGETIARQELAEMLRSEFGDVRIVDKVSPDDFATRQIDEPALTIWLGRLGQAARSDVERSEAARSNVEHSKVDFEQLPQLSRLDASRLSLPLEDSLRNVLRSALG